MALLYDVHDTVTLTAVAKTLYRSSLLQRLFFQGRQAGGNEFDTEAVEIHLKENVRTVANYSDRDSTSKIVKVDDTKVSKIVPPHISERFPIDEQILKQRQFGQSVFSMRSRDEEMAEIISEWIEELTARTERAIELQCANVLATGKVELDDGTSIDYDRDSSLTSVLTGAARWSQTATDPLATLEDTRATILRTSGTSPDVIVMGAKAWQSFRSSDRVDKLYDARRADFGMIRDQRMNKTESFQMYIPGIGEVWTYDGTYVDSSGTSQKFVNDNVVIYGSSQTNGIFYGGLQALDTTGIQKTSMILDRYNTQDPVAAYFRCRSAPIAVPINKNAYAYITVR